MLKPDSNECRRLVCLKCTIVPWSPWCDFQDSLCSSVTSGAWPFQRAYLNLASITLG